jgi:hypothetical protein
VVLDALDGDSATALLGAYAGTDEVAAEPAATRQLVALCGGLPLALRIAGTRLASVGAPSVASAVDQLSPRRQRLDWLIHENLSVRTRLAASLSSVDKLARSVFAMMGREEGTLPMPARISAELRLPTVQVVRAMDELVDVGMADYDPVSGYRLCDLVALYAAEVDDPAERARAGPAISRSTPLATRP